MTLATVRIGWRIQRSELLWGLTIVVALALGIAVTSSAFWTWVLREAALLAIAVGAVALFARSLVGHRSPS